MSTDAEMIEKEAEQTLAELNKLEDKITDEQKSIRMNAAEAGRALNPAEHDEIDALDARLRKVRKTIQAVALLEVQRIDNSQEVMTLRDRITRVNDELKDDLDKLKQIQRYAALAARVADSLASVAASLARVAARAVI